MTERAADRVRVSETRCPYCHDEIVRGDEPVCCPRCHAAHHEACLREHPACSGCGAAHPRFRGSMGGVRVRRRTLRGRDLWAAIVASGLMLVGLALIALAALLESIR